MKLRTVSSRLTNLPALPVNCSATKKGCEKNFWILRALIEGLVQRFVESQVYQAVIENGACEQAAKMVAMKNATENAAKLIDELQLIYNNARQAAITQEIAEIVSGAAAV